LYGSGASVILPEEGTEQALGSRPAHLSRRDQDHLPPSLLPDLLQEEVIELVRSDVLRGEKVVEGTVGEAVAAERGLDEDPRALLDLPDPVLYPAFDSELAEERRQRPLQLRELGLYHASHQEPVGQLLERAPRLPGGKDSLYLETLLPLLPEL